MSRLRLSLAMVFLFSTLSAHVALSARVEAKEPQGEHSSFSGTEARETLRQAQAGRQDFRRRRAPHGPDQPEATLSDVRAEVRFGREVAARILGKYRVQSDEILTRYVNLVGKTLAAHSSRPEIEFHFAVLDTAAVNAYSAPGGYVFITSGAVDAANDEAELAAVLAHEVAHVVERHIVLELGIQGSDDSPVAAFTRFLGGAGDPAKLVFLKTVDKAVEILFGRGYKMRDEYEADRLGVLLLALSGYEPTSLQAYLSRIKDGRIKDGIGEEAAPTLADSMHTTHPAFEKRTRAMEALVATEHLSGGEYVKGGERFDEYLNK